jgi:hypothetical protein
VPKLREERHNPRDVPQRGDWITLPTTNEAAPPPLPMDPGDGWCVRTALAWESWWRDPVSLLWSEADVAHVRDLVYLHQRACTTSAMLWSEIRLRCDALGLTQKGKRDFRWRLARDHDVATDYEKSPKRAKSSAYDHLRPLG